MIIVHVPNQPIDTVYRLRDQIEKLGTSFLFTINPSSSVTTKLTSESESFSIMKFSMIVRYMTGEEEVKTKEYSGTIYKLFRGQYDELYFEFSSPNLLTFFLIETLKNNNIDFEVFAGSVNESTLRPQNDEEEGNVEFKDRISLDSLSSITSISIRRIMGDEKYLPMIFFVSKGMSMFIIVVKVNPNLSDPIENLDVCAFAKLINGRLIVYVDEYHIFDEVPSEVKKVIRWNMNVLNSKKLIEQLTQIPQS